LLNRSTTETPATAEMPEVQGRKVAFKVRISCGCGFYKLGTSWASLVKAVETHSKQTGHTTEVHMEIRPRER
jgi:hypothetical protein